MAKARTVRRQRARNLYVQKIRKWRNEHEFAKPSAIPKTEAERKRRRIFEVTHPLALWPITHRVVPDDGAVGIEIPKVFSFIENSTETLKCLYYLRAALANDSVRMIYFKHSDCEQLDLCASVVADAMILRAKTERKLRGLSLVVAGEFSKNADVNVLLKASGILKHLGIAKAALPEEVRKRLELCSLHIGQPSPPEKTTESEIAATRLTQFFDRCLSSELHRLQEEWQRRLISLITEVIDNCEQHARTDRKWYTIGHFNRLESEAGGECHIVLFNFGDSIYESLNRDDTSPLIRKQIRSLADLHRARGFLKVLTDAVQRRVPQWEEETLWTLYALQEGVSRLTGIPGGEDRGNGTIRMIQFFRDLAGENPRMVLVSGRTYILFDGTYSARDKVLADGEIRKIVAFNQENDLEVPPDPMYVRNLAYKFPGTLVSLRFLLHRDSLRRVREGVLDAERRDDRS